MYLFVYGTLKRGFCNHHVLDGGTYIGTVRIPGFDMYSLGGFPGIVRGTRTVEGEIFEITNEMLPRLDRLEGVNHNHPNRGLYRREHGNIEMPDGIMHTYHAYIYNGRVRDEALIEDGIWRFK